MLHITIGYEFDEMERKINEREKTIRNIFLCEINIKIVFRVL
jgi:hypothetical protein